MAIPPIDLLEAQQQAYALFNFNLSELSLEKEGREYAACSFRINNKLVHFRAAKITPKKIGQFVTVWQRIGDGPIVPYDNADEFDFFIISVRRNDFFGQFIFPKSILLQKNIISHNNLGGKLGIRVYAPWDAVTNMQAQKTKAWQMNYFFQISPCVDLDKWDFLSV